MRLDPIADGGRGTRRPALGTLAGLAALAIVGACGAGPGGPDVLLVSIDTLRADHLSAYGYARETSPFLEELAAGGVLFENAFCQVPDTTPSHTSLLTSIYPDAHGSANGVPYRGAWPTLAERLQERGYATGAFVSGVTMTARGSGLARGFDVYDDELTRIGSRGAARPNERRAQETTERALEWARAQAGAPRFLFVHYFDPHAVYEPPPPYDSMFSPDDGVGPRGVLPLEDVPAYARIDGVDELAEYVARYDGEIRYVDDQLRRLVEGVRAERGGRELLVVVTSDHGEELGGHGSLFAHGYRLHDPSLHVPLVLSDLPGLSRGRRVQALAESVDVVPTVLDLLGLDPPAGLHGRSLFSDELDSPIGTGELVLSRTTKTLTYLRLQHLRDDRDYHSLRGARWKLVVSEDAERRWLFDLRADPDELRNVLRENPDAGRSFERLLRATVARLRAEGPGAGADAALPPADEDLLEDLRALGYVR